MEKMCGCWFTLNQPNAEVMEWQTCQSQKLMPQACGFKSHPPHQSSPFVMISTIVYEGSHPCRKHCGGPAFYLSRLAPQYMREWWNGRHPGLKILWSQAPYEFESRFPHQKAQLYSGCWTCLLTGGSFRDFVWLRTMKICERTLKRLAFMIGNQGEKCECIELAVYSFRTGRVSLFISYKFLFDFYKKILYNIYRK